MVMWLHCSKALGQINLIFCFPGTGAFVFSTPLQKIYLKNRAHNFIKLNFVFNKIWRNYFFRPPPRICFFEKVPEKQKINYVWPYWYLLIQFYSNCIIYLFVCTCNYCWNYILDFDGSTIYWCTFYWRLNGVTTCNARM